MRERCKHLATIEDIQSSKDPEYIRWVDTRLDRWIVDWVLHRGRDKTARHIALEKDIEVSPTRLILVVILNRIVTRRSWSTLTYSWTYDE